jgi:hypothetical protein
MTAEFVDAIRYSRFMSLAGQARKAICTMHPTWSGVAGPLGRFVTVV